MRTMLALLDALLQPDISQEAAPAASAPATATELAFQFALTWGIGATLVPADRAA